MKVLIACLMSWLFVGAIIFILSSADVFGAGASIGQLVLVILFAFVACYGLAWVNTGSAWYAFGGAVGALLIGLPLSFLLLAPFGDWIVRQLFPSSNLHLSGSLSFSWFLLAVVTTIEILTDRLRFYNRWVMVLLGSLVVMLLIHMAELITIRFDNSPNLSIIKLIVYAPLIWGTIVALVNISPFNQEHRGQGEKNEYYQ